jgi:hypothetical protein
MRNARRTMLLVVACAGGAMLAGADRMPAAVVLPAWPAMRDAAPVLEGVGSVPYPTGEIVPPTVPNWLPPAQLSVAQVTAGNRGGAAGLAIGSSGSLEPLWSPGVSGRWLGGEEAGGAGRRLVLAVGPRSWTPATDLSKPYLMWPEVQPDGGRARLGSDPTSSWSTVEALRARVPLRDSAVPYLRCSVPVPVEPGSTIQSVRPVPDEPLPVRPSEVLGSRPRQP